jgi:hypothetical protein
VAPAGAGRLRLAAPIFTSSANSGREGASKSALAQLRHGAAANRHGSPQPFRAFPSWFLRITCERCGKDRAARSCDRRSYKRARATAEQ